MGCNPQDFMRISSKQLGALILLQYCNILHVLKRYYYTLINYANSFKMSKIKAKGSKEQFYGKCKSTSKVDITFLFQNLSFEKEKAILIYCINLKRLNKFGLSFNIAFFFSLTLQSMGTLASLSIVFVFLFLIFFIFYALKQFSDNSQTQNIF